MNYAENYPEFLRINTTIWVPLFVLEKAPERLLSTCFYSSNEFDEVYNMPDQPLEAVLLESTTYTQLIFAGANSLASTTVSTNVLF